jgi:hypothetical protein
MKPAAQTLSRADAAIWSVTGKYYPNTRTLYGTGRCACGETRQLLAYHAGTLIAVVTICEACGDDTLTDKELTKIY